MKEATERPLFLLQDAMMLNVLITLRFLFSSPSGMS